MAILKDIEVRVFSEGKPLHEYDDPGIKMPSQDDCIDIAAVHLYIESKLGANFDLEYKVNSGFNFGDGDCLEFVLSIDGSEISNTIICEDDWQSESLYARRDYGVVKQTADRTTIRRFRFDPLIIDENGERMNNEASASLGHITVAVYCAVYEGELENQTNSNEGMDRSAFKVSEKSIKGHASDTITKFDSEVVCQQYEYFTTERIGEVPLATFNFRYLTHDGLLKRGVIQRHKTPDPFELLKEMTLDRDQIDHLYDIANDARQALRSDIKREEGNNYSSDRPGTMKRPRTQYDIDELEEIEPPVQSRESDDPEIIAID